MDGEKAWSDGEKAGFGHIQATYTNRGEPFYAKVPIGRRSHRGKEKKVSSVDSRNSGIGELRGLCLLSIFPNSTEQALYTIHHAGGNHNRRQSNNGGVGLGSIWETSNSRHMNKPMRESY